MAEQYNGWTNYATWRVQLEIFDGLELGEWNIEELNARDLADWMREHAETHVVETSKHGIARDYAMAFLSYVNWNELAEHAREGYEEDNADESESEDA
jgi:hypothetical protein